jgi:predicted negative regulator of RcsB-dependent stress response
VDRLTRKELKTDKFALEVEHSFEYVTEHRQQMLRYGGIALAILIVVFGVYSYRRYQNGVREDALRSALAVQDAQVGGGPRDGVKVFVTQQQKDAAVQKALSEVANKYPGTEQGEVARYYLGTSAADKGDLATAEKDFKQVIDSASNNYASLGKLALAPIYKSEGKAAEGEKLLRSVIENPSMFVSKEEATIALAHYLQSSNPQQARSLLEPLRTNRGPISRAALAALAEIPQK